MTANRQERFLSQFPAAARRPVVIGMLHVPPLPGSPANESSLPAIVEFVLQDAESLAAGGIDGLLLENFGDAPFYPGQVLAATVAQLTRVAVEVRRNFALPLGINVLRNDALAALSIASSVEAGFIRVNILAGARLTDQGIIEGRAHELLRLRRSLGAEQVQILADVDVKHSAPLAQRPLADEAADLVHRAGADGLIITGGATGQPANPDSLSAVRAAAGHCPVFVGSGMAVENLDAYADLASGFIVGSSLKEDGQVGRPVLRRKVEELMTRLASLSLHPVQSAEGQ